MARTYGIASLCLIVIVCRLLIAFGQQQGNELPTDSGRRNFFCSKQLFPLVWSNMKNAPGCNMKKKFYDPARELHKEIGQEKKVEDKITDNAIRPTSRVKESDNLGPVGPFVANILSGHSGPLCPQCPLIPVIPECPYIPPCPACPTPVCPAIPPFPNIPSCPATVIKSFSKSKSFPKNRTLKSNFISRSRLARKLSPEGAILITNTNGCTMNVDSLNVNLAPCTRGSGAPKGTIDVTFTAPGTSVIIGIATVSPDTPINLTCTSFPSSFFGVTQSVTMSLASPSVIEVGYLQFLASAGRDISKKYLKCFWSSF